MAEELGRELQALFAHADQSSEGAPAAVIAAVLGGARRRRSLRGVMTFAASAAGVLALGTVSWAVSGAVSGDMGPAAAPGVTTTVTATPDPAVDGGDLDGILPDQYPGAAPTHTDATGTEYAPTVEYPDAVVMEDWVWDHVGVGWSVVTVGSWADLSHQDRVLPDAVLYLLSPDGVYFELAVLPDELADSARVVSWDEAAETVRLTYAWGTRGAQYDLRSGEWEPLTGGLDEESLGLRFAAADSAGDELWMFRSDDGIVLRRWDASDSSWSDAAVSAAVPEANPLTGSFHNEMTAVSPSGDRVVLTGAVEGENTGDVYVYTVSTDSFESYVIPQWQDDFASGESHWYAHEAMWTSETTVLLTNDREQTFLLDLESGDVAAVDDEIEAMQMGSQYAVGWGLATDGAVTEWFSPS